MIRSNIFLVAICSILIIMSNYLVLLWVPTDSVLGLSQKIFYLHVPQGMLGLGGITIVMIGSVGYLWRREDYWDKLAYAAAEIGAVFITAALVTGILWSKAVWGVWWTWAPQQTLTLILWFIYVAYLMVRAYSPTPSHGSRYGAILGIIGFVDAPIVYMAAKWWRDVHPEAVVGPLSESDSLDRSMYTVFLVSLISYGVLFAYLLVERYKLLRLNTVLEEIRYDEE